MRSDMKHIHGCIITLQHLYFWISADYWSNQLTSWNQIKNKFSTTHCLSVYAASVTMHTGPQAESHSMQRMAEIFHLLQLIWNATTTISIIQINKSQGWNYPNHISVQGRIQCHILHKQNFPCQHSAVASSSDFSELIVNSLKSHIL